jgi:hypothetical protein
LDRVVAVENLGVHHDGDDVTYKNLNQFLHIENIDSKF